MSQNGKRTREEEKVDSSLNKKTKTHVYNYANGKLQLESGDASMWDEDSPLFKAVEKALEGKTLDEAWRTPNFFISIQNCDQEQVNHDIPSDGNKIIHGYDLQYKLQYLVIMAMGYYIDEIQVDDATVSITTLIEGWLTDPEDYVEMDGDDDDPSALGERLYSHNRDTFGCLYGKFVTEKNPMLDYRVIRAGE